MEKWNNRSWSSYLNGCFARASGSHHENPRLGIDDSVHRPSKFISGQAVSQVTFQMTGVFTIPDRVIMRRSLVAVSLVRMVTVSVVVRRVVGLQLRVVIGSITVGGVEIVLVVAAVIFLHSHSAIHLVVRALVLALGG